MIQKHIKKVKDKSLDIVEYVSSALDEIKKINDEYHYFNAISDDRALESAKKLALNPKGKLAGVLFSIKDCICVKGVESRAGSSILNGYKPVFNSAAVHIF